MTPTDFLIMGAVFLGAVYGIARGLRPALYAAVAAFGILLAAAVLTSPLERLVLNLAGVGAGNFPGAPAVAVLILEGRTPAAYAAAFLPSFLAAFILLAFVLGSGFLGRYFTEPSKSVPARLSGAVVGICAGAAFALLFAVQLLRLPAPPASAMFRDSLIIAALNHAVPDLFPAFSGGL